MKQLKNAKHKGERYKMIKNKMTKYRKGLLASSVIIGMNSVAFSPHMAHAAGGLVFVGGNEAPSPSSRQSYQSFTPSNYGASNLLATTRVTSSSFGRVPLWLAINQVVPASYRTTFSRDINQNTTVSWRPGYSVENILNQISEEKGLNYDVSGHTISFTKGRSDNTPQQSSFADTLNQNQLSSAGGGRSNGVQALQFVNGSYSGGRAMTSTNALNTAHRPVGGFNSLNFAQNPTENKSDASHNPYNAPSFNTVGKNNDGYKETFAKEDHYYGLKKSPKQTYPTSEHQLPSKPFSPSDGGFGVYYAPAKSNLASVIESWAARSGWAVVNDTDDIYYPLLASASFKGNFTDSVATIINSFKDASPYPRVTFYPNHVMRIFTSETSDN